MATAKDGTAAVLGEADATCPRITDVEAFKAHKSLLLKQKLASFRDQLMELSPEEQAQLYRSIGGAPFLVIGPIFIFHF